LAGEERSLFTQRFRSSQDTGGEQIGRLSFLKEIYLNVEMILSSFTKPFESRYESVSLGVFNSNN
jgi:hypothetical protein